MKFNMPMAVFGGLALIAAAIYIGSGSQQVNAAGGVARIAICNANGTACAEIIDRNGMPADFFGGRRASSLGITGY